MPSENIDELPVIKAAKNLIIDIAVLPINAAIMTLLGALADMYFPDMYCNKVTI